MGSIKKIRKKYSRPSHPWRSARIEEENALSKEYGIPRKTEIWKSIAELQSYKTQAKTLSALNTKQAEKEKNALLVKLQSYNLLKSGDSTDTVLGLSLKDVLDRRLQTILYKKNLAKTMKQSRQLIIHRHVIVNNILITSPSHLITVAEEEKIEISAKSPLFDVNHPERAKEEDIKRRDKPVVKVEKSKYPTRKKSR